MSFVMLTDSQVVPPEPAAATPPRKKEPTAEQDPAEDSLLSEKMERATRLFEIISAHSDIDQPICVECTELLVDGLQKRLASSTKERDMYVEILRQFNADVPSEEELQQARRDLEKARERERTAMSELEKLEAERAAMDEELLLLQTQSAALTAQEEAFWSSRNAFTQQLASLQRERNALLRKHENDAKALQRLQRANVYNDTFQISHDGSFGTINGLRLGRLPDKPVDWAEINAAWGHTLHLLSVVAQKLGFVFANHELVVLGSKSKIIAYAQQQSGGTSAAAAADNEQQPASPQQPQRQRSSLRAARPVEKVYELYSSSGDYSPLVPLGGFMPRKLDAALVVFLGLLGALIQHTMTTTLYGIDGKPLAPPAIPYKIEKDRIGDVSIKLGGGGMIGGIGGSNQEESWTKACKNVLICCKFLLAQASLVADPPASPGGTRGGRVAT